MCNPRKVMIHLSRSIEESWRQTVEQTATATAELSETGRVTSRLRLDGEMGPMALEMLERVLAGEFEGFEPWERDERGCFYRAVGPVTMIYDPDMAGLSVETRLTETVAAEGRADAEVLGFTTGEVAVEAVGSYFEDGWGGRTEARARENARQEAEKRLERALDELHREQNAAKLAAAETRARGDAEAAAQQNLDSLKKKARVAMRSRMQAILSSAEEQVYHIMNRAVGEAYRQTLLRAVRENGGRVRKDERTGSVVNLELELY